MDSQGFPLMESPFTILLGPLLLVSTLWFMLVVLLKSTPLDKELSATVNVAKPTKGSSVAIFGLGAVLNLINNVIPFGQAAEGARIVGASRIIDVDLIPSRFELDKSVEYTGHIDAMISAFEYVHDYMLMKLKLAVLVGVPHKE
ncbi:alcohol dehydrogenase 1 [Nicotiana attenuata]|uniref:alcohol dehydrogenase n=1 Tax=Nicotiana attenuata TaxID=49451 RepID=A0A1J6JXX0_NICAT|nr:alcohol dehydrogenase 1 [Nicotiana attenuata]